MSVLRAPTQLYDRHLGWIFGRRFLRLTHTGRTTGRQYQTMLEVVGEKPARHDVIVLAGLGRSAQWNRNLVADNATEIAIGSDRFAPLYRELDPAEAAAVPSPVRAAPPVHRNWSSGECSAGSSAGTTTGPDAKRLQALSELPMIALQPTPILPAPRRSGESPTSGT